MKAPFYTILFITIGILLHSCAQPTFEQRMEDLRKSFAKQAKEFNAANAYADAHDPVDSLYALARVDMDTALTFAEQKIKEYPFDRKWVAVKGDILYYHGHYREAANAFNFAVYTEHQNPTYLVGQAKALVRVRQFDSALVAAKAAALINYDFYRVVGQVFEIQKQADSARFYYHLLAEHDTTVYVEAYQRWKELSDRKQPLLTGFRDSFPMGPAPKFSIMLHPAP